MNYVSFDLCPGFIRFHFIALYDAHFLIHFTIFGSLFVLLASIKSNIKWASQANKWNPKNHVLKAFVIVHQHRYPASIPTLHNKFGTGRRHTCYSTIEWCILNLFCTLYNDYLGCVCRENNHFIASLILTEYDKSKF